MPRLCRTPTRLTEEGDLAKRNFENRTLFHGDNLGFLRGMNSETVDLIATDPPFNKNRDFHATPDSLAKGARFVDRWRWDEDVHPEWVDQIEDDWPGVYAVVNAARVASGSDMAAFLCWLGVRLIEMRRILKPTGSLYLHSDHTALAWTKTLMDGIFGRDNFMNAIVWKRVNGRGDGNRYGRIHDVIMFYTRSDKCVWNNVYVHDAEYINEYFKNEDERGKYQSITLTGPGVSDGISGSSWKGYNPTDIGRTWSVPRTGRYAEWIEENIIPGYRSMDMYERLDALKAADMIIWSRNGVPRLKQYAEYHPGIKINDMFMDIPLAASAKERTGYPTQKPLALYERIIKASSNEGDLVLDPFCGCATTPIAAEKMGRQWVGMDIWDGAHEIVLNRLESEGLAIPRAGGGGGMWITRNASSPLGMSTT